jgi:hypothetical protein
MKKRLQKAIWFGIAAVVGWAALWNIVGVADFFILGRNDTFFADIAFIPILPLRGLVILFDIEIGPDRPITKGFAAIGIMIVFWSLIAYLASLSYERFKADPLS